MGAHLVSRHVWRGCLKNGKVSPAPMTSIEPHSPRQCFEMSKKAHRANTGRRQGLYGPHNSAQAVQNGAHWGKTARRGYYMDDTGWTNTGDLVGRKKEMLCSKPRRHCGRRNTGYCYRDPRSAKIWSSSPNFRIRQDYYCLIQALILGPCGV